MVIRTLGSPSNVDKGIQFLVSRILVLVLFPMLDDYFNGYTHAHSFGIVAQIKNMRESLIVFASLGIDIYAIIFWMP
jgi:hypothetical protein